MSSKKQHLNGTARVDKEKGKTKYNMAKKLSRRSEDTE